MEIAEDDMAQMWHAFVAVTSHLASKKKCAKRSVMRAGLGQEAYDGGHFYFSFLTEPSPQVRQPIQRESLEAVETVFGDSQVLMEPQIVFSE